MYCTVEINIQIKGFYIPYFKHFQIKYSKRKQFNTCKNKNDNIHKNEKQQVRWTDEYWQFRVAANITEYQNNLPKFMKKRQLFYVKNVCKNVKNQQV